MPSVKQYQALQFNGFARGLNNHADSSRLENDELAHAMNVRLGPRGETQIRTGYSRFDDGTATAEVSHLFRWRTFGGQDYLFVVDVDGSIRAGSTVTFPDSLQSVPPGTNLQDFGVGMAGANKDAYLSSKTATAVVSFDGSNWAQIATIPVAKSLHHRHDRLFAVNTTDNPSRIFFSDFLDPEVFQAESWIDLDPDDGFEINASAVFGDDLLLFKDRAIWKLSGRTPASFATYRVDSHRGTIAPRSLSQLRGRLVFMDRDTGVWAFDGANFELLSEPINDYLLENQDYDLGYLASAYVAVDRMYLSVPWKGGGHHTFAYFADTGGWVEYDTGFEHAVFHTARRFHALPGAVGVYENDPDSQLHPPSVTPLVAKFRTPWVRVGGPGLKARIRRIEMTVKATATTDFTVRMFRDFDGTVTYVERTFTGGPVPYIAAVTDEERVIASDGWGNRLHAIQFEIETNDAPFQLNDMTVFYTGGVDVRGER